MRVLCWGEILWDFLPEGLFAGGAPFNVGYHFYQQGAQVRILSAIGDDVLGRELLRRLQGWGMDTGGIRSVQGPTGYVEAEVDANGNAHYHITADVAWDHLKPSAEDLAVASAADVVVYGSLAQRSATNRTHLRALLAALPKRTWRVFDVNLRAPHDDLALVRELAGTASLLKLNAEEAARIATGTAEAPGAEEQHARILAPLSAGRAVCITAGARGAGLWWDGVWYWEPGRNVEVADTVGAGDAFLATLVSQLHRRPDSPPAALAHACRVGEWVASRRGATPKYPPGLISA